MLGLLVDSTGIKFLGEGECKRKKHGAEYRRQWRKVHLGIDASTPEIRAIEVTDNSVGDAPMLPQLLGQIPPHEPITSVSADGAYDTKACHAAIVERGAQAVIPPRKNAQAWKATLNGALARNEALKACRRLGRRIWKKWSGYHRCSLVETKMHCFKRLGEWVMACTFERQVVELHVRSGLAQPFHAAWAPEHGACARHGIATSGVGGLSCPFRLVQQSRMKSSRSLMLFSGANSQVLLLASSLMLPQ